MNTIRVYLYVLPRFLKCFLTRHILKQVRVTSGYTLMCSRCGRPQWRTLNEWKAYREVQKGFEARARRTSDDDDIPF